MGENDIESSQPATKLGLLIWALKGVLRAALIYFYSLVSSPRDPDAQLMSKVLGEQLAPGSVSLHPLGEAHSGGTGHIVRVRIKGRSETYIWKRTRFRSFKDCVLYGLVPTLVSSEALVYENQGFLGLQELTPKHYYSFYKTIQGKNGILMEDMGTLTGGKVECLSKEQVISILRTTTRFYNITWKLMESGTVPAIYDEAVTPLFRMFPTHWANVKHGKLKGVHAACGTDYYSDAGIRQLGELLSTNDAAYKMVLEELYGSKYRGLAHGDARSSNVFFRPDGSAVICDWQTCFLSNPLRDMAWTVLNDMKHAELEEALPALLKEVENLLDVPLQLDVFSAFKAAILGSWFFNVMWINVGVTHPDQTQLIEVQRRFRQNMKWAVKHYKVYDWCIQKLEDEKKTR